jgi:hypothetical protein
MKKLIPCLLLFLIFISNNTYSQEAKKQTRKIYDIGDLLKNPSFLKGQLIKATFKIFQKVNSKSYLVEYQTEDLQTHLYYIQKGTIKQRGAAGYGKVQDLDFDFVDDQHIKITAIVSGSYSYQTRLGITSTVTKLTVVDIEPVN